jgi:uncharacterized protein (TIGR03382 family)
VRWGEGAVVLATFAIAAANWLWARRRTTPLAGAQ